MANEDCPAEPALTYNHHFIPSSMPLLNWDETDIAKVLSEPSIYLRKFYETYGRIVGVTGSPL